MDENLSRGYIQLGWGSRADRLCRRFRSGHPKPPEDRCHCVYLALVLAGVGFLLPYNSFIIAVDYFQDRYPGTTIVFDMSLVYILVAFVAVVVNNLLVETLSLHVRIVFGYILSFCTLLFVAVFEIWFETFDNAFGYKVNLIAVAVVAFGCTVQQSSFYGYTSMLPSRYTQAVMTGESAAGLLISVNRILTKALLEDERFNTVLFFCLSLAVVSVCFIVHFALQRTEFVRFYVSLCSAASNESDEYQRKITLEPTEDVGLVDMLDPAESKSGKYGVLSLRSPPASPQPPDSAFQSCEMLDQEPCMGNPNPETFASSSMALHHRSTENIISDDDDPWRHSSESVAMPPRPPLGGKTYRVQEVVVRMRGTAYTKHIQWWGGIKRGIVARWQVAKSIWPYMLSIALAYFVTLTLFPGIESEIISCRLGSWMPVIVMAIFNFFDFLGKILASIPYDWSRPKLVLLTFTRILLVPLMAMCAAPRGQPLIPGEGWAMCFSLLLGISNGIFGSVPMILAPSRVPDEQKELTGNIMTLSYSVGLTTGSGVAYLIDYLIGPPLRHPCEGGMGPIKNMFPIKQVTTAVTASTNMDLTKVVSSTLATLTSSMSTIIPSLSNGTTLAATVATTILTTNSLLANVTSNSSLSYSQDLYDNSTVVTITV